MKKSKFIIVVTLLAIVLLGTAACSNSTGDHPSKETDQSKSDTVKSTDESPSTNDYSIDGPIESDNNIDDNELVSNSSKQNVNEQEKKKASEGSDLSVGNHEGENPLSQYSNEQIEYARVWLQLGPNQDIDELNVRHILAGEPINPNDDTSANYPE